MKVGDRVVCINAQCEIPLRLIKNHIYTISEIIEVDEGCKAVQVKELPDWHSFDYTKMIEYLGYSITRFRKIEPNFTNALTRKLAEDFIEEDSKVIETERERVLTLNAEF